MKINVQQIEGEIGGHQDFSLQTSIDDIFSEETPWLHNLIAVKGKIVNSGKYLEVRGIINATGRFQCHRCLELFNQTMEIPFCEKYTKQSEADPAADVFYYQNDEIDLNELIRENMLLAVPLKSLCREDCRGLCPLCGCNLNREKCSCEQHTIDPRLAILKHLK